MLDPGAGLTQVLTDGTNTYLYGNARLAQSQASMQYFGADGLGSVRQLYDASAMVVGSSRYDPLGNVMSQGGTASSAYAFTGEWTDSYIKEKDGWHKDPSDAPTIQQSIHLKISPDFPRVTEAWMEIPGGNTQVGESIGEIGHNDI